MSSASKMFSRFASRKKSRSLSSSEAPAPPPMPPMPSSIGHSASSAETAFSMSSGSGSSHYSSIGAERSMAEVALRLDHFFENMDLEDTEADTVSLSRSIQKAECYSNAYLTNCQLRSITLGPLDQRILNLAALSIREVYAVANESDAALTPLADEYTYFEPTNLIEKFPDNFPEGCGIVKAATVRVFDAEDSRENTVVVALRGATIRRRDFSGNDEGESGDGFIGNDKTHYMAHPIYLNVAKKMAEIIAEKVDSILSQQLQAFTGTTQQLLFTGHSAGGAVAALLYAHAMSGCNNPFTKILSKFSKIYCISFGAPPVTNPPLPPPNPPSLLLSVCNDGDPVPRGSDSAYYSALASIYTSPMDESAPTSNAPYSKRKDLPNMSLHNAGVVGILQRDKPGEIIKKDPYATIEILEPNPPPIIPPGGTPTVAALKGTMAGTVMGNPRAHEMDVYLKRLRLVSTPEPVIATAITAANLPDLPSPTINTNPNTINTSPTILASGDSGDGRKMSVTSPASLVAVSGLAGVSATGAIAGTSAGAGAPHIEPDAVPEEEEKKGEDNGITIEKLMEMSKKDQGL